MTCRSNPSYQKIVFEVFALYFCRPPPHPRSSFSGVSACAMQATSSPHSLRQGVPLCPTCSVNTAADGMAPSSVPASSHTLAAWWTTTSVNNMRTCCRHIDVGMLMDVPRESASSFWPTYQCPDGMRGGWSMAALICSKLPIGWYVYSSNIGNIRFQQAVSTGTSNKWIDE